MGPRAGLDGCGKSRHPTGIRSPDRQARSESLYRLSYRGIFSVKVRLLNVHNLATRRKPLVENFGEKAMNRCNILS